MLLVTNNYFFHHVGCDIVLVCFFEVQVHFFLHLIIVFVFFLMNLFVLRLVMNLVMCMEAAMRNIQHVFIALCDLGVLFLFFFLSRESRKAVNFILRHCTIDQSCKYFTSTKKNNQTICFVVSQQIKKVLLFYVDVFCGFHKLHYNFFTSL